MAIAIQADDSFIGEFPTPATTLDYGDEFGSIELREKALVARNSSFALCQFTLTQRLKFSDKYYEAYEQFLREFGPIKGKTKFNLWTKSETFGIPNKMLSLARDFSPWFRNLTKPLQSLVCRRILELNINILKKLIIVPSALLDKILTSGENITVAIINKALAAISPPKEKQLKLREEGYAQIITVGHALEGQIGQVKCEPDEYGNIVLVMFPGGPEQPLKIEDLNPVKKPKNQLEQIEKKYNFILEEKEQEIEEKVQEGEEKDRQIEYLQNSIKALTLHQENPAVDTNIYAGEEIEETEEMKEIISAQIRQETEAAKADAIASIQKEQEQRQQEWEQKYQEYLEELQEERRETARLEAQRLEAVVSAQEWQERAQNLEKMILELPTKRENDLGAQESFLIENAELKKQVEFLLKKNAELEQVNKQELEFVNATNYEPKIRTQRPEGLSDHFTEALELTTEETISNLMNFEVPGWGPDGYRAKNNNIYPLGPIALKCFLEDFIEEKYPDNNVILGQPERTGSPIKIAEYSRVSAS